MARLVVVLLAIVSAATAIGQTAATCPWVASGTAEHFLGGEVSLIAHIESNTAGSCTFTRQGGKDASSIEIRVGSTDTHACPRDSAPLKALGNEAVQCRVGGAPSQTADRISGRVRRVFFVVTMTNIPGATKPEPSDPRLADAYAASPLERLAEQVAGNLF